MAAGGLSKRLVASYVVDWIVLVIIGVVAVIFNSRPPQHHAFSLLDLSISYPLLPDTVPIWVDGLVAGAVPALLIIVISLVVVPGRHLYKVVTRAQLMKLKLWECHAGILGLAMSLVVTVMITAGLKLFGKPRPNCLARCQPDLAAVSQYVVGGDGQDISIRWTLVTSDICQQPDRHILDDGFQSWPSGHSSLAWSGLLYLTLFLSTKFSLRLPRLPLSHSSRSAPPMSKVQASAAGSEPELHEGDAHGEDAYPHAHTFYSRNEAAGPPTYLLFVLLVPLGAALYISLTRYMDYAHHGFDILSGSVIGIVCAYVSFRWYHPGLRSQGWAWGPRSPDRAFGIGVGSDGFVRHDLEGGRQSSDVADVGGQSDRTPLQTN